MLGQQIDPISLLLRSTSLFLPLHMLPHSLLVHGCHLASITLAAQIWPKACCALFSRLHPSNHLAYFMACILLLSPLYLSFSVFGCQSDWHCVVVSWSVALALNLALNDPILTAGKGISIWSILLPNSV